VDLIWGEGSAGEESYQAKRSPMEGLPLTLWGVEGALLPDKLDGAQRDALTDADPI